MAFQIIEKDNKASVLEARYEETDTELVFRVPKQALLNLAKPSSTGDSQGLMLKLNAAFDAQIGDTPLRVSCKAGRAGAGTWFSLSGTPL